MTLSELVNSDYTKGEYSKGKCYLLRGRSVYQLHWSSAQQRMTTLKLYTKPQGGAPLVGRGRIVLSGDGAWVNKVIGQELLASTNFEA